MKVVIVTGGFDPLHSGHINYIRSAQQLGDYLVVGLNSDAWLTRKKGRPFMPFEERYAVLDSVKGIDWLIGFNDDDGSAIDAIIQVKERFPNDEIIFANGGDRTKSNIPEMSVKGVEFVFGVGGEHKMNSSSWILQEWKAPKTERSWGYYREIYQPDKTFKAKELTVNPGASLSMQQHNNRAEHWFVAHGYAAIYTLEDGKERLIGVFGKHQSINIPKQSWHRLANETNDQLKLIELQYGTECVEEDIVRKQ